MIRGLSALAQLWTPLPHGCHADVTLTFYIGAAPSFIRHLDAPLCRAVALAKAEAHPVEVEVNCGWGDPMIVTLSCNLPTQ